MTKTKAPKLFLVAVLTDKPDAWDIKVLKEAKGMQFTVAIAGEVLNKVDTKFINANIQRFTELKAELPKGDVTS